MKTAATVTIRAAGAVAICLLCLWIYLPALNGTFVYDDMETIVKNRYVKDLAYIPDYFNPVNKEMWSFHPGQRQLYRPLLLTTFALNYAFSGLDPFSYHLVNLLLHLVNAVLVFVLFAQLPRLPGVEEGPGDGQGARIQGAMAAMLFAVHPLQTEAVSYIVSRSSVLATFFVLCCLIAFFNSLTPRTGKSPGPWRLAGLFCFVLSLLTKEIGIIVPLLVLLSAFTGLPTMPVREKFRRAAWAAWPYFFCLGLYLVPRILLFGKTPLVSKMSGLAAYFVTASRAVLVYLKLTFWPAGQNVDHFLPMLDPMANPATLLAPAALILLAAVIFIVVRPRSKPLFFAAGWWGIALLPNLFLPTLEPISEHSAYLPSVGLSFAIAYGLWWAWDKAGGLRRRSVRMAGAGLFAALVVQLGFLTMARNLVWQNEMTLWTDAVAKSPMKTRPMLNLGDAYLAAGGLNRAARAFHAVLAMDPENTDALNNLGILDALGGNYPDAERWIRRAIALDPGHWKAQNNLGRVLLGQGQHEKAVAVLRVAARNRPDSADVQGNLGWALIRTGQRSQGCRRLATARRLNADNRHHARLYDRFCTGGGTGIVGAPGGGKSER